MATYVIKNVDHVDESSNEVINRHTVNRNFLKLLENDQALAELMNSPEILKVNIKAFNVGQTYSAGDLVWFKDYNDGVPVLHVLRSLFDSNTNTPAKDVIDGIDNYEHSGWKDEYQYGTVIETALNDYLSLEFNQNLESGHVLDTSFHPHGQLTESEAYDDTKLLKADLVNIQHDRVTSYFPYETVVLSADNVIQSGFYRKWDCGLLEYDIIYKLGSKGEHVQLNGTEYEVIHANQAVDADASCFFSADDRDIFSTPGTLSVQINGTVQVGLNSKCNTYSATIQLPEKFKDAAYMAFGSDVACQELNSAAPTIDSGFNTIIYSKKTTSTLSPLLIVFPAPDAKASGIVADSFHCYLVGRWK